jgi:peroxiredoxin
MRRHIARLIGALLAGIVPLAAGCSERTTPAATSSGEATTPGAGAAAGTRDIEVPAEPRDLLQEVAAAYREADSYADEGRIEFRMRQNGEDIEDAADFAVVLRRPHRVRLRINGAQVACDGRRLRALIENEALRGDMLDLEAPAEITPEVLHSDRVLAGFLTQGGIAGGSVQLALLFEERALEVLLQNATDVAYLDPAEHAGTLCQRVQAARPDGNLVFWIEASSLVLRRLDFPAEGLKQRFAPDGPVESLSLWADFREARLNDKLDDDLFVLQQPEDATLVTAFDLRKIYPPPPALSPLLGQPAPDFTVTLLDGSELNRDELAGSVAVLGIWALGFADSHTALADLDRVYRKFRDDEGIRFVAVSVDPPDVTDAQIQELADKLQLEVPLARAPYDLVPAFQVEGIPNLFVIGPDGRLQDNEVGLILTLADELPVRLRKLLTGKDVFPDAQVRQQRRMEEYEATVASQGTPAGEQAAATIAERSEPQRLTLTKLWECQELAQPGNLLVVPADGDGAQPTILVHDGWHLVAELSATGDVVQRHALDIPDEAVVSTLRTAVDGEGHRYFAALASAQLQVHVYDGDWQKLFSFPEGDHAGVADALLADLEASGKPALYVSYWGDVGVQRVGLDGQRAWGFRKIENVYRLAQAGATGGPGRLLCVSGERGLLVPLDADGHEGAEFAAGNRYLRSVYSADLDGDGQLEYCGIAPTLQGAETVLGFDLEGTQLWSHDLGPGSHPTIEAVTSGRLLPGDDRQWIVATPDGGVLVIDATGELVDHFHYGAALSGIAAAEADGRRLLLLSTARSVTCFEVGE